MRDIVSRSQSRPRLNDQRLNHSCETPVENMNSIVLKLLKTTTKNPKLTVNKIQFLSLEAHTFTSSHSGTSLEG